MKISKYISLFGLVVAGFGAALMLATGCQNHSQSAMSSTDHSGTAIAKTGKGAAELWAQNCMQCHNVRSPSVYSDAEWDTVMLHMRVRANLAASDAETIAKFLKSAN